MNKKKLYGSISFAILTLSGCTSNSQLIQLQNKSIQQSQIIQKQQKEIAELKTKLKTKKAIVKKRKTYSSTSYSKPKKNIKLKKVEDHNYNSSYMYPDDKQKKTPEKIASVSSYASMNKIECIAMIGDEKFNRYTQMFGSEDAAIKRCAMIKAMKK